MVNIKKYTGFSIFFGLLAIGFASLYHFHVIGNMNLQLAATYVCYFVGLTLFFVGAFTRAHGKTAATVINFLIGTISLGFSIVILIHGFITGAIVMFN